MSRIQVSDLPVGTEFFQDAESFLMDLEEAETSITYGGIFIPLNISVINIAISEDIFAPSISIIW
ncbi:MAG: hypothetical protein KME23_02845 [Goleter apudmare HA4340-LM2]|jgi:hypothetical protein|nr:hypothetical protein [Goleter apudmare HA4340-LM2]